MTTDKANDYLEQEFPKGNKFRGQAMVLFALAEIGERNKILKLIEKKQQEGCSEVVDAEQLKKEIKS